MTPLAKFRFTKFTASTFDVTRKAWKAEAAFEHPFSSEVDQVLQWASEHIDHRDGDSTAYGVFEDGKADASAICEVVINRRGVKKTWIKHLRLTLRPELDDKVFGRNFDAVIDALDIFSATLMGIMRLKMDHMATTVKVYARTSDQLSFLQQVVASLKKNSIADTHKISIDGRFLVIANKG